MGVSFARKGMVLALAVMTLPAGLATANAAANQTVASWELNELADADAMTDSSPNGIEGVIQDDEDGDGITTGVDLGGATGYNWTNTAPNQPPAKPYRVIQVDDDRLNPGTRDWAISFRYRTDRPFGNIMQKGQSKAKGGQIKFQLPQGNISCMFKGATGLRRSVRSKIAYDDGQWHVVRCERTANRVEMKIWNDQMSGPPVETRRINGPTGNLDNSVPMTVGGKINCNQTTITCDYFVGDIDWIKVESS